MDGKLVIKAKVSISGSKSRVAGWRYCQYIYDTTKKTCKFDRALTCGMYPNKGNYSLSADLEELYKKGGIFVHGRPTHKKLVDLGVVEE